jgi:hypothetical protein
VVTGETKEINGKVYTEVQLTSAQLSEILLTYYLVENGEYSKIDLE